MFRVVFFPLRLTHDISLDEFEDEDLSEITEITDERGMSLNCNSQLDIKVRRDLKGYFSVDLLLLLLVCMTLQFF